MDKEKIEFRNEYLGQTPCNKMQTLSSLPQKRREDSIELLANDYNKRAGKNNIIN